MPPFDTPTVVITRPRAASEAFHASLAQVAGAFVPMIRPAFELVSTNAHIPEFEAAIFTSRAGVSFAPDGKGRTAYCVGAATAAAATKANYTAISAEGSAADLCKLILDNKPSLELLHIRGEVSHGDVMATLRAGGVKVLDVVAYRKEILSVDATDLSGIGEGRDLIFPVFSAETVSIIGQWQLEFGPCHIVAISDEVARAAASLCPAMITVSNYPNMASMVAATARLIA